MEFIVGMVSGVAAWLVHFLVHTLPPWLLEHKMWLIALIPVFGVIALYKYLWP